MAAFRIFLCVSLTLSSASLAAQTPSSAPPPVAIPATAPVTDTSSVQFDLASKHTGRTYRIFMRVPKSASPAGGWPVITVLDGNSNFATAASQVLLRTATGQSGAVVVAVGYPDAAKTLQLRFYDLTPSQPLPGSPDRFGKVEYGGSALFRRFLVEELRPVVAAMAKVDPGNQSLLGYSLGGLFALGELFEHHADWRTIVAGSPSIWWNGREILEKEAAFAQAVRAGKVSTRVLISANEWEQFTPETMLPSDPQERAAEFKEAAEAAMVDNEKNLAGRLASLSGPPEYRVRYVQFPEETHLTGIPAYISRGIAFTFAP